MKVPGMLSALKAILSVGRELSSLNVTLTRIADALERQWPPTRVVPEAENELVHLPRTTDADYAHFEAVAARLQRVLGREPTIEEMGRELDGEEWSADESERAYRARRPDLVPPGAAPHS